MLNPNIFGPNIKSHSLPITLLFAAGGVGDYINWCSSIEWISKEYPQVDAHLFSSELFLPVLQYLFKDKPRWVIRHRDELFKANPEAAQKIVERMKLQMLNACGAHLMDLGFYHFACIDPAPPEARYLLEINLETEWLWPELDRNRPYAVFTPGSTTDVREMPVFAFNELVNYCLSKGVTPVFLGKRDLSETYAAKFLAYDFTKGVDLRERTSLIQATHIMKHARFVIGLDNGLLHMAGTTNVPVIFGHNITEIHHRTLRRRKGLTVNVTADRELVPCIGCQSRMRFISKHDFRNCFFKEYPSHNKRCLPLMFKDGAKDWKKAIDFVLEKGDRHRDNAKTHNIFVK